jgi:hypothetical protein
LPHGRASAEDGVPIAVRKQTNSDRNKFHSPPTPRIFGQNSGADQMDKPDIVRPCPEDPTFGQNGRTGPLSHRTHPRNRRRRAMRFEYDAMVAAGFDLQVDRPDLAMGHIFSMRALIFLSFANGQPSTSRRLITRSETSPLNECAGSILEQQRRPAPLRCSFSRHRGHQIRGTTCFHLVQDRESTSRS